MFRLLPALALLVGCGAAPTPASRMLRQIPADTPVAVWVEPVPDAYAARLAEQLPPALDAAMDALIALDRPDGFMEPVARMLVAVAGHFRGRWDAASRAADGLLARPHVALYTRAGRPYLRIELASGERFLRVMRELAATSGVTIPDGDDPVWDVSLDPTVSLVLAVRDDLLSVAVVPADETGDAATYLRGEAPPERSLADTDRIADLKRTYGVDGILADIDLAALAQGLLEELEADPGCVAEYKRLAAVLPRVVSGTVFGADPDLDVSRTVVPLSPAAISEMKAIFGPPPGLGNADYASHLVLGGVGLRLGALIDWLDRKGAELRVSPVACDDLGWLNEAASQWGPMLGQARETPLPLVTGVTVGLTTLEFGPAGIPSRVEAMVLLGTSEAEKLVAEARALWPMLGMFQVPHGGEPARLPFLPPDAAAIVGSVVLASGDHAVGLATGEDAAARLSAALDAKQGPDDVFLEVEADVQFFNEVERKLSGGTWFDPSSESEIWTALERAEKAISGIWGRGHSVYRVTKRGIEAETRQRRGAHTQGAGEPTLEGTLAACRTGSSAPTR